MQWLRVLLTLAVLVMLETTVVPRVAVAGARPQLLLVFVVWRALGWPLERSYLPAWLAGLARDVFSGGSRLGAFAALYLALALVIGRLRRELFVGHIVTQVVVVAGASLLSEGLWMLVWFHPSGLSWPEVWWRLLGGALYSAGATPLVLGLLWVLGWRWR